MRKARLTVSADASSTLTPATVTVVLQPGIGDLVREWWMAPIGAIGPPIKPQDGEFRTWRYQPKDELSGMVIFYLRSPSKESDMLALFNIDVSAALKSGKITVFRDFPFVNGMRGPGEI